MLPKDEYFCQKFTEVIENINGAAQKGDNVKLVGRVYEFLEGVDGEFASFKLNYYKDNSVNVFISKNDWENIKKYKCVKDKAFVRIEGKANIWKRKSGPLVQILASKVYREEAEDMFYVAPKAIPKDLPKENPRILLISNVNGAGKDDFQQKLYKNAQVSIFDTIIEGDNAIETIPKIIKEANESKTADLICIVRGGGDTVSISYVFDNEIMCKAIQESKIPILLGVGHNKNFTNADRASDAPCNKNGRHRYFMTPTDLASFLNSKYYFKNNLENKVSNNEHNTGNNINMYLVGIIFVLLLYIFFAK